MFLISDKGQKGQKTPFFFILLVLEQPLKPTIPSAYSWPATGGAAMTNVLCLLKFIVNTEGLILQKEKKIITEMNV